MNGVGRLAAGAAHEYRVQAELESRGWVVQPWGQGVLDERIRSALQQKKPPCAYRWFPDQIAAKGNRVCFVDPKSDIRGDTPNFSIEQAAFGAHMSMWAMWGIPTVYVFHDLTCNLVYDLVPVQWFVPDPGRMRVATSGSGTPFLLVRKDAQKPLDALFGEAVAPAA